MATMKTGAHTIGGVLHSPSLPVVLTLAAMIVGLAALLPLIQSSGATTTAGQIRQLQQEQEGWQARNRELEVEMAGLEHRTKPHAKRSENPPQNGAAHGSAVHHSARPGRPPNRDGPAPPSSAPARAGNSLWDDLSGWLPLP